ncbi:branched-chain amino acid transporter, partial [Rothia kristinae]
GIIAGALLAVVYVGLGVIGHRIPDAAGYPDGASLLSAAAAQTMGRPGAWVFGLIVLLACLTTSVGLLGATSEFFAKLVPAISYRWWAVIFTIIAFLVSTLGLSTVIAIAGPIVGFLYPAAITLIFLTLVEPLLRRRLNLTYVFSLTVAIIWSALMSADSLGWVSSWIEPLIGWAPGYEQELGWFFPTLAAAIVGYIIDLSRGAKKAVPVGGETKAEAEDRVLG